MSWLRALFLALPASRDSFLTLEAVLLDAFPGFAPTLAGRVPLVPADAALAPLPVLLSRVLAATDWPASVTYMPLSTHTKCSSAAVTVKVGDLWRAFSSSVWPSAVRNFLALDLMARSA